MPSAFTHLEAARNELTAASIALKEEISAYPTPIAGCDAQFNHLLASKKQVEAALGALNAEIHIPTPRAL